jgi:hypothetical protein
MQIEERLLPGGNARDRWLQLQMHRSENGKYRPGIYQKRRKCTDCPTRKGWRQLLVMPRRYLIELSRRTRIVQLLDKVSDLSSDTNGKIHNLRRPKLPSIAGYSLCSGATTPFLPSARDRRYCFRYRYRSQRSTVGTASKHPIPRARKTRPEISVSK